MSVLPSMEILLSSYSTISLPRPQWPAREEACAKKGRTAAGRGGEQRGEQSANTLLPLALLVCDWSLEGD